MAATTTALSDYVVRMRADISQFRTEMGKTVNIINNYDTRVQNVNTHVAQMASVTNKASVSIGNSFKKIGGLLAGYVSVRTLVGFGKESLTAASKLNAMAAMSKKAFSSMSADVGAWAKNASTAFGLSNRMALQYTAILGSMASGFGITESKAVEMSEQIAGRIGDLASYYSITQDEAYNKMAAIFTGETEALKSLGIVMTQTALDAFALANGFGKTTAQMTEQEKVMLRYKFLMDQTRLAEGDFVASTQRGSWGNQIRRLKLQIEDFKAAIGQGLIKALTPAMDLLNRLMTKLVSVANAFSDLMSKLTGSETKAVSSVVPAVNNLGEDISSVGAEAEQAAQNVTKATKEAEKEQASFDELHVIGNKKEDASATADSTPEATAAQTDQIVTSMEKTNNETAKMDGLFDRITKRAKELAKIFKDGWKIGFGEQSTAGLEDNINRIKKALREITQDPEVQNAQTNWVNSWTLAFGEIAGAASSISVSIATLFTGGLARYLEQNQERIKKYIIDMFDISSEIAELQGTFATALADIFTVFESETAQQAMANFIGIFADAFMGVTELCAKLSLDIQTLLMQPIIDNSEKIKTALDGLIEVFESVTGTIKDTVDTTVDEALKVYDEHIHPLFESLTKGLSEIMGTILDVWNKDFKPVLDDLAEKFDTLCKDHLQPLINTALEVIGQVADTLKPLWENILVPLFKWIVKTFGPIVAALIKVVGTVIFTVMGKIMDHLNFLLKGFKLFLEFLEKVFSNNWKKTWETAKDTVVGCWNWIKDTISSAIGFAKDAVDRAVTWIKDALNFDGILSSIKNAFSGVKEAIAAPFEAAWNVISPIISAISNFSGPSVQQPSGGSSIDIGGYATGGFPEDGLFLANHGELVGKFSNGKTAVVNNGQIIEGVTRGVKQGVSEAMARYARVERNSGGGDTILMVDGEELARATARGQSRINKRTSPSVAFV